MPKQVTQLRIGLSCLVMGCMLWSGNGGQQSVGRAAGPGNSLQELGTGKPRYPGPRWTLLYGSYEGIEEFAVNELQRMIQRPVPYVLEVLPATQTPEATRSLVLVGTPAANPRIAELGKKALIKLPTDAEG
jgi:hypothetical protein